jgi:cysteine desulfurase/selenocysteine lyase
VFDVEEIRNEFPILKREMGGKPIVFADNAATSLKPMCVINTVEYYYTHVCANVHRGVNVLAEEADGLYEDARKNISDLINAKPEEIIFVRNATEGINLAAHILNLTKEDEIICSLSDHHSNFLPWFVKAKVKHVMPDEEGRVTCASFIDKISSKTKLIALGHVSNVTGIVSPVGDIIQEAKKKGILTLIDGAQSITHIPINVRELGCDFLAFSGHKMLGPSGIGVLYARRELLESGLPMLYGGGMVASVTQSGFKPASVPHKFEAGTPNIEGAIGMGAAAKFLATIGMENIYKHSKQLTATLVSELDTIKGLRAHPENSSSERMPIASFTVQGISADNIAAILCNRYNVMVRSGVHCAEPLLRHFGERGLVRISLYLYNTIDEVAYITESLRKLCQFFA